MLSAPTREELLNKLIRGDMTDSGGGARLVVFNPDEEKLKQAQSIVEAGEPNRGTYDIWFSSTALLTNGGKIAYVFPGFWDQVVTETDSLSDACSLPRMDQLIAEMKYTDANGVYYQRRYNTKWLCISALEKYGIVPDMYLGYSLGEWEAALFAGIITCDIDTWTANFSSGWDSYEHFYPLVLVDGATPQQIDTWCKQIPDLYVSIDNCPCQVILVGTEAALATLTAILDDNDIIHVVIPQRTALHTPLVAGIPKEKFALFRDVDVGPGQVPLWSATTLEKVPTEKEAYLDYLFSELTKTVRFREAVAKLYDELKVRIFIQIGPGPLPDYVASTLQGKDFGSISTSITARDGADQLRRVMALLYIEGGRADPEFMGVTSYSQRTCTETLMKPTSDPMSALATALSDNINSVMSLETSMTSLRADMISIQQEMAAVFDHFMPTHPESSTPAHTESSAPAAARKGRKGATFTETLHLSFDDHPYLIDHCIVRQPKDWATWEDMNPVVPFTMIVELFADLAMKRAPGEKLTKISNVIAFKWMEVVTPLDITVKGEWSSEETLHLSFEGYASADCTLAKDFPAPDLSVERYNLGEQIAPGGAPEQWYEQTFHGPAYQSIVGVEKICERGIVARSRNKGGKGSLLDAVGQLLGLYIHITQTDNTIVFPVSLTEVDLYADIHDQDGIFDDTMIVTKITDTAATTDTVITRDGAYWCVVKGLVLTRFASTPSLWQVILDPRKQILASEIAPGVFSYVNTLHDNMLGILTKRYLSKSERDHYDSLASVQLKRENLISRIALKDAVRSRCAVDGEMMYPIEFSCVHDDRGQPYLQEYGDALHISLSHKGNTAVAIVSDKPVGIDLEKIEEKSQAFVDACFTPAERELLAVWGRDDGIIRLWVAKEAYSKMVGEGLKANPKRFEITDFEGETLIIEGTEIRMSTVGDDIVGWTSHDAFEEVNQALSNCT